jgi:DNA-binding transcriptional MerR regulator
MDKYKMGALEIILGTTRQNILKYEKMGRIPNPRRTESGHRIYNQQEVDFLSNWFLTKTKKNRWTKNANN